MSENLEALTEISFELPTNLYVPSPPLWIESKGFKGPLDLLWHLIREQDIDILDIPVALIAAQYLNYIQLMVAYRFEVAPDYLVMAVRLIQIKSEMLLPKVKVEEGEDGLQDPRALLIKQLVDYADIQKTAVFLDTLKRWYRDVWPIKIQASGDLPGPPLPDITQADLSASYQGIHHKKRLHKVHEIARPMMGLSQKMAMILDLLPHGEKKQFVELLPLKAEKVELALSFQASLELLKTQQIDMTQSAWNETLWLTRLV